MPVKAVLIRLPLIFALLAACKSKPVSLTPCASDNDCVKGDVCIDKACVVATTCASLTCDASKRQGCEIVNKQAACVNLGCRTSADCTGSQVCVESACTSATASAASCEITNESRVSETGGKAIQITAVGYDASGAPVPYATLTSVSVDSSAHFTANTTTITPAASAGVAVVTATVGGATCTAKFNNLGANAAGTFRVYLYEVDGQGVADDTGSKGVTGLANDLVLSDVTTGSPRVAVFTEVDAANSPGVYTAPGNLTDATFTFTGTVDYQPIVVVGVPASSNQLAIPLNHLGKVAGFGGQPDLSKYTAKFPTVTTPLTAVVASASIPPSALLSLNLSLFTGDTGLIPPTPTKTAFDYVTYLTSAGQCVVGATPAGASPTGQIAIPRLVFADYNGSAKGADCNGYAARALPGRRVAWSLGTQINFTQLFKDPQVSALIKSVTSGSSVSLGAVLPVVLPLLSQFASGTNPIPNGGTPNQSLEVLKDESLWVTAFSQLTGFAQKPVVLNNNFPNVNVSPGLPLANNVNFPNPGLGADPAIPGTKFDVAATIIAVQSPAFGLVPLGVGAGLDVVTTGGTPDGKFDSLNPADLKDYPNDVIYTRYSSPGAAVSDGDIVAVTIETNLGDLAAKTPKSSAIRIRGNVARSSTSASKIGWSDTSPSLPSLTDTSTNVAFYAYSATPTYSISGASVISPALTKSDGVDADLIFMGVSGSNGAGVSSSINVLVNPADLGAGGTVAIPSGALAGLQSPLSFTTIAIKFRNGRTFADLASSTSGIDFETLAGDMVSLTAYSQSVPVAAR